MNFTGTFNFADYKLFSTLAYTHSEQRVLTNGIRRKERALMIVTYAIENARTGMAYVGSTERFIGRWGKHLSDLRAQRHSNVNLQKEFDEHGPSAFSIRILRSCETTNDLLLIEEIDGKKHFKEKKLLNVRLGNTYINGHNNFHGNGSRTKRGTGKVIGRKNQVSRWFDGTRVVK